MLVTALLALGCPTSRHAPITGRVETEDLPSQLVGDTYRLWVRLPPEYDQATERHYAVVYQLDANFLALDQFNVSAGAVSDLAARSLVPEAIVVGIGYPSQDVDQTKGRFRDYTVANSVYGTGGAGAFLRFLAEELFPHIEAKYRALSTGRTISGHSLGGFFALHSLMQPAPLFENFIAADPSFADAKAALFDEVAAFAPPDGAHFRVYLSLATIDDAEQNIYFEAFYPRLQSHSAVTLKTERFQAYHTDIVTPSFESGLEFTLGAP